MIKPTLLVLAAGMGSRYGGLKQMDAFGPHGETILDYSIFDAVREGYGKVVFVVREHFMDDFKNFFKGKFEDQIDVNYVTQELHKVPEGISYREEREKPWGTAHAVLMAADVIDEPFAVINADDFYGRDSFRALRDFFRKQEVNSKKNYALVAYDLAKTLSDHGTVNRGVCREDEEGNLLSITECLNIGYDANHRISFQKNGNNVFLEPETPVSMNMWGFYPDYFSFCEEMFRKFLIEHGNEMKSEFFIPILIDGLIRKKRKKVVMVRSREEWFGVTYKEDKPFVINRIKELIEKGAYPSKLWRT